MTDYTPTTERIRAGFEAIRMISEPPDGFDLWLADHNRKIAAEALRKAARSIPSGEMWPEASNPVHFAQRFLRARADRIEQGDDDV